jgi:type IV secretion system protein TrbE
MSLIGGGLDGPFDLPLEVAGVKSQLIFGPLGTGKSSLIGQMVCSYLAIPNSKIFWLDVDHSSYVLAHCLGADYYEPGADNSPALCPLALLDTPGGAEWLYGWFERLLARWDYKLAAGAAKEFGFVLRNAIGNERYPPIRRLSDFRGALQNHGFGDLFEILSRYCQFWRHIFDGEAVGNTGRARLQVFEMRRLWEMSEQAAGPATELILHQIISQLDGSPAWVFLDEFGLLLRNKIVSDEWIDDAIRSMRRKNCGLIAATHDVSDIANRPDYSLLLINFPGRVFLPNPQASGQLIADGYRRVGLNEQQINCIAGAIPKREALYTSPLGTRLAGFPLGEISRHIIGATDLESVNQARRILASKPDDFTTAWLNERIPGWEHRFPGIAAAGVDTGRGMAA